MKVEPGLFPDAADALGIPYPVIIEKDVYAVELLRLVSQVKSEVFELVFAGGTSLAKAHKNTYRMSEDIDIKLVARPEGVEGASKAALKAARRCVLSDIENVINSSQTLALDAESEVIKRNEYRFAEFTVRYPRTQPKISALRPHLKLDVTESNLWEPLVFYPIASLYAQVLGYPPEVASFPVAGVNSTIAEKLIALLRRTALIDRDVSKKDDETLVRHMYDIHCVASARWEVEPLRALLLNVINEDAAKFGRQHPEFESDPVAELHAGLRCLQTNPRYQDRYDRLIGPLVYHESPATWKEALQTLEKITHELLTIDQ